MASFEFSDTTTSSSRTSVASRDCPSTCQNNQIQMVPIESATLSTGRESQSLRGPLPAFGHIPAIVRRLTSDDSMLIWLRTTPIRRRRATCGTSSPAPLQTPC
jgi:hypothetical protein